MTCGPVGSSSLQGSARVFPSKRKLQILTQVHISPSLESLLEAVDFFVDNENFFFIRVSLVLSTKPGRNVSLRVRLSPPLCQIYLLGAGSLHLHGVW